MQRTQGYLNAPKPKGSSKISQGQALMLGKTGIALALSFLGDHPSRWLNVMGKYQIGFFHLGILP